MARAERRADVVWEGNLVQGHGKVVSVGSGALGELPITWASRTERSDGRTSPEELLAAAHAVELRHLQLAQAPGPPEPSPPRTPCRRCSPSCATVLYCDS